MNAIFQSLGNFFTSSIFIGIIQVIAPLLTSIILFISCIIAFSVFKLQQKLKQVDIMLHCQGRFNDLMYKDYLKISEEDDIYQFYDRYWLLQLNQFHFWEKGLIEDEIFKRWIQIRKNDFANNKKDLKFSKINPNKDFFYTNGFDYAKKSLHNKQFVNFIDILKYNSAADAFWALKKKRVMKKFILQKT